MPINEQIERIIERRRQQCPALTEKISQLQNLSKEIVNYDNLRRSIVDDQGNLKEDCPFKSTILGKPDMVKKIHKASTETLKGMLTSYQAELENQLNVCSRESISLMIFGYAGAGKSTLIQQITGLDNNVVLASGNRGAGIHCTGASSYIYNKEEFEARVFFYTKEELLEIFNTSFKKALQRTPYDPNDRVLGSFADIENFKASSHQITDQIDAAKLNIYQAHFKLIDNLTSGKDEYGHRMNMTRDQNNNSEYLRLTDKSQVQQYVAQYNGKDGESMITYYKYLAVKRVDIYTPFPRSEVGKIVLMDNVGLGNPTQDEAVMDSMCKTIANNSDAVLFLYSPPGGGQGQWTSDQARIIEYVNSMRIKDKAWQEERMDVNQLFFLINKRENNEKDCKEVGSWFGSKDEYHGGGRDETCIIVNAIDQEDTNNALMLILNQMIEHLPDVDKRLFDRVNGIEKDFVEEFKKFLGRVDGVLVEKNPNEPIIIFEEKFDELVHGVLRTKLLELLEYVKKEPIGGELYKELRKRCTPDMAQQKVKDLEPIIESEYQRATFSINAYYNVAAILRHSIPNDFREIDISLKNQIESVKSKVFGVLHSDAKLSLILSKSNRETNEVTALTEWGRIFTDNVLNKNSYPLLHKLFSDLLSFHQNVDGFLLPKVIKHLDFFSSVPTIPSNDSAREAISKILSQKAVAAFQNIRNDLTNFLELPNESLYFAVDEFSYGMIYSKYIEKELRVLYSTYMDNIWEPKSTDETPRISFDSWNEQLIKIKKIGKDFAGIHNN